MLIVQSPSYRPGVALLAFSVAFVRFSLLFGLQILCFHTSLKHASSVDAFYWTWSRKCVEYR